MSDVKPVIKISMEDCFCVARFGYGLDESFPDEMFYCGAEAADVERARAAAEADAAARQAAHPSLSFAVRSVEEQISAIREEVRMNFYDEI